MVHLFLFQSLGLHDLKGVVTRGQFKRDDFIDVIIVLSECHNFVVFINKTKDEIAPNEIVGNQRTEVNDIGLTSIVGVDDFNWDSDLESLSGLFKSVEVGRSEFCADITAKKLALNEF